MAPRSELEARDRTDAIEVLRQRLTHKKLREIIDSAGAAGRQERTVEAMVASASGPGLGFRLPDEECAAFVVDLLGADLLAERTVRHALMATATVAELDQLLAARELDWNGLSPKQLASELARIKWHAGGAWPRAVCECLSLPRCFAGQRGDGRLADHVDVDAYSPLPPLERYQVLLTDALLQVISGGASENRALVELPTGAGKTRVAVEALLQDWLRCGRQHAMLWIAQSEELCEQAVQCFIEVWTDLGHRAPGVRGTLPIERVWDGRPIEPDLSPGLVVASIQQLHSVMPALVLGDRRWLGELLRVVVVDEAHLAVAPSYRAVLEAIGIPPRMRPVERPSLIGLTATPFRSSREETSRLKRRFQNRELVASGLGTTPEARRAALVRDGVLAKIEQETLQTGIAVRFTSRPALGALDERLDDRALRRLAGDATRNKKLLARLTAIPADWPVLLFACSVNHAQALTMLLRRSGRSAAFVSGETRTEARKAIIEKFRAGEIQFLCNCNVLTTGFDAPVARVVVMARPTESAVLYMQMVGRGLRGPRFGGTEECLVIDVVDSIMINNKAITSVSMADALREENTAPIS